MALMPPLWFSLAPAVLILTTFPSGRAWGLAFFTLDASAFCGRGIKLGPHSVNNRMKIDIGIDKSGEGLQGLGSVPCRQGLTHADDLTLYHLRGRCGRQDLQALVQEGQQGEIACRRCQGMDRRRGRGGCSGW